MMHKVKYILGILLPAMLIALTACQEDELFPGIGPIPEGETTVQATISFQPFAEGLTTRSAGGAIKTINNLCVFVYKPEGELVSAHYFSSNNLTITTPNRTDADAENGNAAETTTPRATFNLTLPYGAYCIYAVANMGDLTAKAQTDYNTIDKLKSINLTWHSADANDSKTEVAHNNEMFGYFTATYSDGTTAPTANNIPESVVLNKPGMSLHSWIKRAASKVTVAYDATNLNNNVYIYLKSVTIKDIPKNCFLGKDYPATPTEATDDYQAKIDLIEGETIKYADDADINNNTIANLPCIVSGSPYYYYGAKWDWVERAEELSTEAIFQEKAHAENMEALYFYENLQGKGITKMQDADGDKQLDRPGHPKWAVDKNDDYEKYGDNYQAKDGKTYGTYIEVKAYYVNKTTDVSEGEITYRFMLGQNTETDYNAKRNYHYKVTLCFNKDANDVDWHIEYEEGEPALYVPDTYYISYLYDQKMVMPIKVTGDVKSITATIVENHWWPDDAGNGMGDASTGGTAEDLYYYVDTSSSTHSTDANGDGCHNGFLSLVRPRDVSVFSGYSAKDANTKNIELWSGQATNDNRKRGERTYMLSADNTGYDSSDSYQVEDAKYGAHIFHIPFFTRSKNLGVATGHTGNNLFTGYTRTAKVKIVANFADGVSPNSLEKEVTIIQVKRLVNPKGIWRSAGNTSSFNVVLMEEDPNAGTDDFVPVVSHGGWRAYVESEGDDWILLNGEKNNTVEGGTESEIRFTYAPEGSTSSVRCGIIRIDYNDYTCTHRIFVRQGYAPLAMPANPAHKYSNSTYYNKYFSGYTPCKWHTFNLYHKDGEVSKPVDEGSLFKVGNVRDAILSTNNKKYGFMASVKNVYLDLYGGSRQLWTDYDSYGRSNWYNDVASDEILPNDHYTGGSISLEDGSFYAEEFEYIFKNYKLRNASIATFKDWAYLTLNFDQGYGVLYDDDATETSKNKSAAYEYGLSGTGAGMRGCFIYDVKTGDNLFFPIGATGYGRRLGDLNSDGYANLGTLRYGGPSYYLDNDYSGYARPFLFDLVRHQGALYWCKEAALFSWTNTDDPFYVYEHAVDGDTQLNHRAWDINYYSFGFNTHKSDAWPDEYYTIGGNDLPTWWGKTDPENGGYSNYKFYGPDACFIRLVEP